MTKKEFKEAMLRGLGRCVRAVEQEPERYRALVLWACQRDISYDTQCEGTRAWYVYTMVSAYGDKEPFIRAAADALRKYRANDGWGVQYLSELLMLFTLDGSDIARQALEEKYQQLLTAMHTRQRRPNRVFHERSDLEQLGLTLSVDSASFLRVAADFGRLYRQKKYMVSGDFDWFFAAKGTRYKRELLSAAKKDENIACFLQREQDCVAAREASWEQRKVLPIEKRSVVALSRWLAREGNPETVERYALAYRNERQPDLRAQALKVFFWCPYPDDPVLLIEDTRSDCAELRDAAWRALEGLRHPAVRMFALQNANMGINTPENFGLLVSNYQPEDGKLLEKLLREMIAAKDWDSVHWAGLDVYRAFYKGSGIPHPKHLLPALYEYNPCSCCRESALTYMSKHRMLTEEILEECLYDSNDEIRTYAEKRLRR